MVRLNIELNYLGWKSHPFQTIKGLLPFALVRCEYNSTEWVGAQSRLIVAIATKRVMLGREVNQIECQSILTLNQIFMQISEIYKEKYFTAFLYRQLWHVCHRLGQHLVLGNSII